MLTHVNVVNDHYPFKNKLLTPQLSIIQDISICSAYNEQMFLRDVQMSEGKFTASIYCGEQKIAQAQYTGELQIPLTPEATGSSLFGFITLKSKPTETLNLSQPVQLNRDTWAQPEIIEKGRNTFSHNITFIFGTNAPVQHTQTQYILTVGNQVKYADVIDPQVYSATVQGVHTDIINSQQIQSLNIISGRSDVSIDTRQTQNTVKVCIKTASNFQGCSNT